MGKKKIIVEQLKNMLHNAEMYKECGIRFHRGLLLNGEPRVGKIVLARSIADEQINFIELITATSCFDEAVGKIKEVN